eukprot:gene30643-37025_t
MDYSYFSALRIRVFNGPKRQYDNYLRILVYVRQGILETMFELGSNVFADEIFGSDGFSVVATSKESNSSSPLSLPETCIDFDEAMLNDMFACLQEPTSVSVLRPMKRVRMRRRAHPFLRVIKADIRRKYPMMFINVVNSCDPDLMCRFFTQFCVPHCQLSDSVLHPHTREKTELFVRSGLPEIQQFATVCATAPDFILQLQNACIKQSKQYTGSKVVLQVQAKVSSLQHFLEKSAATPEKLDAIQAIVECVLPKRQVSDISSGDAGFRGSVTFVLDEEHRLEHVDMEVEYFL